jgi:serine phosphatase RsbU (regulator of sigma subunit)
MSRADRAEPADTRSPAPHGLDLGAVFRAVPTACVVLDDQLVIQDCSDAYLRVAGRGRERLLGRGLFDAFPDVGGASAAVDGVGAVLRTALTTGRPVVLGTQRYDTAGAGGTGAPDERYWAGTAVPLPRGDQPAWVLFHVFDVTALAHQMRREGSKPSDVAAPEEVLRAAMAVMEQTHLFDEAVEAERRLGVAVQSAMLPTAVPEAVRDRVAVAVRYRPASASLSVGGDWYDVTDIGDGRVAVAVGDVVGHGLVAASVMGQLRGALAALTVADVGPPQALAALDQIARHNPNATASTAVKVVLDPHLGFAAYSSAGHLPPLLAHPDGTIEDLDGALGPPLAVTETIERRPLGTATVGPGSTLLLYTDGLVERRGEDLDLGIARLRRAFAEHRSLDVEDLADRLLEELTAEAGLRDDVALVLLRL